MKLQSKILLSVLIALTLFMGGLYSVVAQVIMANYDQLDRERTAQAMERALNVVQDSVNAMQTNTRDWAAWDDTYAFIEDGNQAYLDSNISQGASLDNYRLNLVAYIHASGRIVYATAYDLPSRQFRALPEDLARLLSPGSALIQHASTTDDHTGVTLTESGPLLLSAQPIVTTDGEGPIRGTLIFGRYLDRSAIDQLRQIVKEDLNLFRFDQIDLPVDVTQARKTILADPGKLNLSIQGDNLVAYATMDGLDGKPALIWRISRPRDAVNLGRQNLAYLFWSLLVIDLFAAVAIIVLLRRLVLRHLGSLGAALGQIGQRGSLAGRVAESGSDEIAALTRRINETMAALEQAQAAQHVAESGQQRSEEILQAVAQAAGQFLKNPDWESAIQEIIKRLGQATGVSRVYLFINRLDVKGKTVSDQRYEWVSPGITAQIGNQDLQRFDWSVPGFPEWAAELAQGQTAFRLVRNLPPDGRAFLEEEQIKTILLTPITVDGKWWGVIGFDECQFERDWTPREIESLRAMADLISAAVRRAHLERERQEIEQRYRSLVELLPDPVAVHSQGKVLYVNPAGLRAMGAERPEQVVGTPIIERVHPDYRDMVIERVKMMTAGGVIAPLIQEKFLRLDGSSFDVEVAATPISFDGKPSIMVVFRDVTRQLQDERDLKQRNAELEQLLAATTGREQRMIELKQENEALKKQIAEFKK